MQPLANTFSSNSSNLNYDDTYLRTKNLSTTLQEVDIKSNTMSLDPINTSFTEGELNHAVANCKNPSPGPDDIPTILIKDMPKEEKITYSNSTIIYG